MIIIFDSEATSEQIHEIMDHVRNLDLTPYRSEGNKQDLIGIIGDTDKIGSNLQSHPAVKELVQTDRDYKLASRDFQSQDTAISLPHTTVGSDQPTIMAGPCAIESYEQTVSTARHVKEHGATLLRGGAYKPRTSPYSFQGLGEEGLEILQQVKNEVDISIVTEVMSPDNVNLVNQVADVFQIGSRNMQNFPLLKEVGKTDTPILLKRAMSGTLREFLLAAEYILREGNREVMLCERGIKTFQNATRNTLDLSAVPVLQEKTHLPVIIDPSHASGNNTYVPALAKGAVAAGADGLLVEVHPDPPSARCDGEQSLTFEQFKTLIPEIQAHASVSADTGM